MLCETITDLFGDRAKSEVAMPWSTSFVGTLFTFHVRISVMRNEAPSSAFNRFHAVSVPLWLPYVSFLFEASRMMPGKLIRKDKRAKTAAKPCSFTVK